MPTPPSIATPASPMFPNLGIANAPSPLATSVNGVEKVGGEKENEKGVKRKAEDPMDLTELTNSPSKPKPSKVAKLSTQPEGKDKPVSNGSGSGGGKNSESSGSGGAKSLVQLKKKKLVFLQEPVQLLSYPPYIKLLSDFHEYFEALPAGSSMEAVPERYHSLVVMIGQEYPKQRKQDLVKEIISALKPASGGFGMMEIDGDEGGSQGADIDPKAIKSLVDDLFTLENYGLSLTHPSLSSLATSLSPSTPSSSKPKDDKDKDKDLTIPPAMELWRWEAKDLEMYAQAEEGRMRGREMMRRRREMRVEAREEVGRLIEGMERDKLAELLGWKLAEPKEKEKQPKQTKKTAIMKENENGVIEVGSSPPPSSVAGGDGEEGKAGKGKEKVEKEKKVKKVKEESEDQKAKRLLRESKLAKKAEEEARREAEKRKGAQLMSGFFVKPAAAAASSPMSGPAGRRARSESRGSRESSTAQLNEFQTSFHPFEWNRKTTDLAPVNGLKVYHAGGGKEARGRRMSVISVASGSGESSKSVAAAEEVEEVEREEEDVIAWEAKDFLKSFLTTAKSRTKPHHRLIKTFTSTLPSGQETTMTFKTPVLYKTVTQIILLAQDSSEPREVYKSLKRLSLFPRKVLKFAEDSRPAYVGTWSRPSTVVGPRSIHGLDPFLDYSLDEGLDWEEECNPEEDINNALDEHSDDGSDEDSTMGEWMVPDDEIEWLEGEGPGGDVKPMMDGDVVMGEAGKKSKGKGKAKEEPKKDLTPARKKIIIPSCHGPVWEKSYAEVVHEAFAEYKICFLNDTPMGGIDPLSFISEELAPSASSSSTTTNPTLTHLAPTSFLPLSPSSTSTPPTKPPRAPQASKKSTFPVSELPAFLRAIHGSEKGKLELEKELLERWKGVKGVTGVSVRGKFGEVGVREGRKGVWGVTDAAWLEAGIEKPETGTSNPSPSSSKTAKQTTSDLAAGTNNTAIPIGSAGVAIVID